MFPNPRIDGWETSKADKLGGVGRSVVQECATIYVVAPFQSSRQCGDNNNTTMVLGQPDKKAIEYGWECCMEYVKSLPWYRRLFNWF